MSSSQITAMIQAFVILSKAKNLEVKAGDY